MSNFAVAFSYISVSTGTFTLIAVGLAVSGPSFFWSWPLVILGQTFVALNFAELASHFPVAGSIYQWSKRLSNKTLGWFTGWIYFWAGVLTTTAVAITVPLVLSSIFGTDLASASPISVFNMGVFLALITLITTTLINAFGVRALSIINNLGVGAEILGLVVFALILLVFFNHQPLSVLTETAPNVTSSGGVPSIFLVGMFMSLFVVYGFDTAGTFGEETLDASRQAPRGILSAIWLRARRGALPAGDHPVVQGCPGADPERPAVRMGRRRREPDRRHHQRQHGRLWARCTSSSSSPRSTSAPWRSRARPRA